MMMFVTFNENLQENYEMDSLSYLRNDLDEKIKKYLEIFVEWQDGPYDWINELSFSYCWNENPRLFSNDKVFIPRSLEDKVHFLIKWNVMNNYKYWTEHSKFNSIPSFFQYVWY